MMKSNKNNTSKGIIRVQKNRANPYVMINKQLLENPDLSWKAKGLLAYLLSKPDNWQIRIYNLIKQSRDGEKSVRSGLRELEDHLYIQRFPVFTEHGINHWESIVYETPFEKKDKIKLKKVIKNVEHVIYKRDPQTEIEVPLEDFIDIKSDELLANTSENICSDDESTQTQSQTVLAQKGEESESESESVVADFVLEPKVLEQNVLEQNGPPNNKRDLINNEPNNKSVYQSVNNKTVDENIDASEHPILSQIQNLDLEELENPKPMTERTMENHSMGIKETVEQNLCDYEFLIKKCQIEFLGEYKRAVEQALRNFFFCQDAAIKLNNQVLPLKIIKQDLMDLDFEKLNCAITKFRLSAEKRDIQNKVKYLQSCIYDVIFDYDITNKTDDDLIKLHGPAYYMPEGVY